MINDPSKKIKHMPKPSMNLIKKITLSAAPFYASLVVVTSLALFIGVFWAVNEYQAYQESIDNIRTTYRLQYEGRVKEELIKAEKKMEMSMMKRVSL